MIFCCSDDLIQALPGSRGVLDLRISLARNVTVSTSFHSLVPDASHCGCESRAPLACACACSCPGRCRVPYRELGTALQGMLTAAHGISERCDPFPFHESCYQLHGGPTLVSLQVGQDSRFSGSDCRMVRGARMHALMMALLVGCAPLAMAETSFGAPAVSTSQSCPYCRRPSV